MLTRGWTSVFFLWIDASVPTTTQCPQIYSIRKSNPKKVEGHALLSFITSQEHLRGALRSNYLQFLQKNLTGSISQVLFLIVMTCAIFRAPIGFTGCPHLCYSELKRSKTANATAAPSLLENEFTNYDRLQLNWFSFEIQHIEIWGKTSNILWCTSPFNCAKAAWIHQETIF